VRFFGATKHLRLFIGLFLLANVAFAAGNPGLSGRLSAQQLSAVKSASLVVEHNRGPPQAAENTVIDGGFAHPAAAALWLAACGVINSPKPAILAAVDSVIANAKRFGYSPREVEDLEALRGVYASPMGIYHTPEDPKYGKTALIAIKSTDNELLALSIKADFPKTPWFINMIRMNHEADHLYRQNQLLAEEGRCKNLIIQRLQQMGIANTLSWMI